MKVTKIALPLGARVIKSNEDKTRLSNSQTELETANNPSLNSADAITASFLCSFTSFNKSKTYPQNPRTIEDLNEQQTEQLSKDVVKKASTYGLKIKKTITIAIEDPRYNDKAINRQYALQAVDVLLDHPELMKNKNLQFHFPVIYCNLVSHNFAEMGDGKVLSQCLVNFINTLTSKENAKVLENNNVQDLLGLIFQVVTQAPIPERENEYFENITKFLKFLQDNPEYASHRYLSTYIKKAGDYCDSCIEQITQRQIDGAHYPFYEPQ